MDSPNIYPQFNTSKDVVEFLSLNKSEVSKAFDIPKRSIRYDDKIPAELKENLDDLCVMLTLVADYFNGDMKKTSMWFNMRNTHLRNMAPRDMIRFGQYKKLFRTILGNDHIM